MPALFSRHRAGDCRRYHSSALGVLLSFELFTEQVVNRSPAAWKLVLSSMTYQGRQWGSKYLHIPSQSVSLRCALTTRHQEISHQIQNFVAISLRGLQPGPASLGGLFVICSHTFAWELSFSFFCRARALSDQRNFQWVFQGISEKLWKFQGCFKSVSNCSRCLKHCNKVLRVFKGGYCNGV